MPGITGYVNSNGINEPVTVNADPLNTFPMPEGMRLAGWVYVLKNEYMPDVYKIGMTVNEPEIRASQISQGTGIPFPFDVHTAYYSDNPQHHEAVIHDLLKDYRISQNREFFHCSLEIIQDAFSGEGLIERGTSLEVIADSHEVICLEKSEPWSLEGLLCDLNISVFGCKYAAIKRMVELAAENVLKLNRRGYSLLLHNAQATPLLSNTSKLMQDHENQLNAAGAYGPKKPWRF